MKLNSNFIRCSQSLPPMLVSSAIAMAFNQALRHDFKDEAASVIDSVLLTRPDCDLQVNTVHSVGASALLNRHPIYGD